ncbi:MAG: MTAP family purine nucleoside phosphorylase [Fimbriimonadaceae bacterium]|nr:MTAP family purine nucleoside phosphorylase [Fimbriimonadaceae bacterium]
MARYSHSVHKTAALRIDYALIGGTGIGSRLAEIPGSAVAVPTPYGMLRGKLIDNHGKRVLLVQRHSAGHKSPPHLVNYRAIVTGIKQLGAQFCISSAAVGCLRAEWPVGSLAVCSDFLDLSARNLTLFDHSVEHRDFSKPFPLSDSLLELARKKGVTAHHPAVYVTANGPRYETPTEIQIVDKLGGDVVGMTASTEAILMREAEIPYGCLAIITNQAAGMSDEILDHTDVVDVMNRAGQQVVDLMLDAHQLVK